MPRRRPLILVIDDDPAIRRLVKRSLEMEGYRTIVAGDGQTGLRLVEEEEPALVILDIMMPGMDGFQVCEQVRRFSQVSIVMLTARGLPEDAVHGLDLGADDYIAKPFSTEELSARVKTVLRRSRFPEEMPQHAFACGKLSIDFSHHCVTVDGKEVMLTNTEYRLFCLLAANAGKVLTQDQLLTGVWGWEYRGDIHILQVVINRLRKRIEDDPGNPRYIVTRSGIGYECREPDAVGR
ncbi:MAG: response regulator transcription factor [Chloroflexi bacterium]|nr:response regulator transcription factor [Chloroflexota bacterium]